MIKKISRFMVIILSTLIIAYPTQYSLGGSINRGFGEMVGVRGVSVYGTQNKQEDSLLHTIRVAINWVLGMLAFVCLCLTIYAGFLMLTSGGDEKKYKEGFSIIKNAGIGLAIIAVSRLIVSLIFYLINTSVVTISETES